MVNTTSRSAQLGDRVGDLATGLGQRFGLGPGAVPDGHVVAGVDEAYGHRRAHPAGADPADPQPGSMGVVHVPAFAIVCVTVGVRSALGHRQPPVKQVVGAVRGGLAELFALPDGYEVCSATAVPPCSGTRPRSG